MSGLNLGQDHKEESMMKTTSARVLIFPLDLVQFISSDSTASLTPWVTAAPSQLTQPYEETLLPFKAFLTIMELCFQKVSPFHRCSPPDLPFSHTGQTPAVSTV